MLFPSLNACVMYEKKQAAECKARDSCRLCCALLLCVCSVVSRMETPDHWITYAHVVGGEVMNSDARTAVHRRKVGNYY